MKRIERMALVIGVIMLVLGLWFLVGGCNTYYGLGGHHGDGYNHPGQNQDNDNDGDNDQPGGGNANDNDGGDHHGGGGNGNSNHNANGNANTNSNSNGNSNGNQNTNTNGNSNGNNQNGNGNTNVNTNSNGNGNTNHNANGNSNGNSNGNQNTNSNSNQNTNANANANDNGNHNSNGNDNDHHDHCQHPQPVALNLRVNGQGSDIVLVAPAAVTVTWNVTGATSLSMEGSVAGPEFNPGDIMSGNQTFQFGTGTYHFCLKGWNDCVSANDCVIVTVVASSPAPTADVKANGSDGPIVVDDCENVLMDISSANATNCIGTGSTNAGAAWLGQQLPLNGQLLTLFCNDPGVHTLGVSCTGPGGTTYDQVQVTVRPPVPVWDDIKVNGSDGPITVFVNEGFTVSWASSGLTHCEAFSPLPEWRGTIPLNGSAVVTIDHPVAFALGLSCLTDQAGVWYDEVDVTVAARPLPIPLRVANFGYSQPDPNNGFLVRIFVDLAGDPSLLSTAVITFRMGDLNTFTLAPPSMSFWFDYTFSIPVLDTQCSEAWVGDDKGNLDKLCLDIPLPTGKG